MKTYTAIVTETVTTRVRFRAENGRAALKESDRIERHFRQHIEFPKGWRVLKPKREVTGDLEPLTERGSGDVGA
ncbi:MAG: hypothetical protein KGJ23_07760 [Euryarchaeota archaeon]|nr:hypothetical protein [Euryarchaeota archaeon]MDE1836495.1 hypothetical protein [Euryarchaeota archaeon]MDE1880240.1 hypothetical protein [Euryarchaeota archaeon]MDE2044465.1 hypothetical protein [Thermoplasmata archaeon]